MEKDTLELFGSLEKNPLEKWRVVYTKPRREKKLANYAKERGIYYYLPLIESVREYKDRKATFWKPLFPSYIFVRCDVTKKDILQISGHTKMFLPVPNEAELIHDLQQIYKSLESGAELQQHPYLENGARVKIIDGPFSGIFGYVSDAKSKETVVLQIQMLQKAVAVKVKSSQVQIVRQKNK
jgi:transcription antitermination factor NusG